MATAEAYVWDSGDLRISPRLATIQMKKWSEPEMVTWNGFWRLALTQNLVDLHDAGIGTDVLDGLRLDIIIIEDVAEGQRLLRKGRHDVNQLG